ncbi:MAG: response regulator [Chloroflexi bacterium]|nr:response regulator [Chloroflexota bacterium]
MPLDLTEPAEPGTGPRVVVVDADPASGRYVSHVLRRMGGNRLTTFEDPATALRYLEVSGADLLLAELDLPGMTGLELARRARLRLPALPVMIMATSPSVDAAVEAVRARVDDFLVEPIQPTELLDKVGDAIARAGGGGRAGPAGSHDGAVTKADRAAVLVHPFSILPKVGLSEADIPDELLRLLAERWGKPGRRSRSTRSGRARA